MRWMRVFQGANVCEIAEARRSSGELGTTPHNPASGGSIAEGARSGHGLGVEDGDVKA